MALGWAIIGTGRVSDKMAGAIQAADDATLVAVLSRNREKGNTFAAAHGSPAVFQTLDDLLRSDEVDVVYIASPNILHSEQAQQAARSGKHVFCEKPMALDPLSGLDMIHACRDNGVTLGIGFHYRQHPAHQFMRDIFLSGHLGQGVFADASAYLAGLDTPSWYNDPELSAGSGVLSMSGVHRIDLLRFIMDAEVDEVSAFVDTRTEGRLFDDSVTAMLRFDNGVVATIRFAIEAARAGDPVAVYCSEGSITTIETTSQWWVRAGGKVAVLSQGKESLKEFEITDLYLEQVESFKRAINGEESQIATGEDGLRAVEIASAIYDSARRRQVVRVGRQES